MEVPMMPTGDSLEYEEEEDEEEGVALENGSREGTSEGEAGNSGLGVAGKEGPTTERVSLSEDGKISGERNATDGDSPERGKSLVGGISFYAEMFRPSGRV